MEAFIHKIKQWDVEVLILKWQSEWRLVQMEAAALVLVA